MIFPYKDKRPQIDRSAYLAPTCVVIGEVTIDAGVSIWFNTVIRADINQIRVGKDTNIQDGCLLHVTNLHPVVLEERITVGHGAILHSCHIESDSLVSMGAIVLDGARVGTQSIVAAGAVVPPGVAIPPRSLVMGVPAKVIRELTEQDLERIKQGWQNYRQYADIYKHMPLHD